MRLPDWTPERKPQPQALVDAILTRRGGTLLNLARLRCGASRWGAAGTCISGPCAPGCPPAGHPLKVCLKKLECTQEAIAGWAKTALAASAQVVSDGLWCFGAVTASGATQERIVTGCGPACVKPGASVSRRAGYAASTRAVFAGG